MAGGDFCTQGPYLRTRPLSAGFLVLIILSEVDEHVSLELLDDNAPLVRELTVLSALSVWVMIERVTRGQSTYLPEGISFVIDII